MTTRSTRAIHRVRVNTFDDGNKRFEGLPNNYQVIGADYEHGKYTISGNGFTFKISMWKTDPIFSRYEELLVGTRVCKVNTRINAENIGCYATVVRHAPAHTYRDVSFPDGLWVTFDGEKGESLVALTDVRICM